MLRKASICIVVAALCACDDDNNNVQTPPVTPPTTPPTTVTGFQRVDLVSDQPGVAPLTDANLVNPWGLAAGPGAFWIADNGTGALGVKNGDGTPTALDNTFVLEPGITGIVVNTTREMMITLHNATAPATFLVASETGKVWAVNQNLDRTTGVVVVDRSSNGAIYKGLAIADNNGTPELLVADFHNARIDVFNGSFQSTSFHWATAFQDMNLPPGFAPFDVAVFDNKVYVTYAMQDANAKDDVAGPGLGIIDIYSPDGTFQSRFATGGTLNAPWGMAMAPSTFGAAANLLLVGNFGDGMINEFDPTSARFVGQLTDINNTPFAIDGLWGLAFGNGVAGDPNKLYFTAGPEDETHGLFGRIELVTITQ